MAQFQCLPKTYMYQKGGWQNTPSGVGGMEYRIEMKITQAILINQLKARNRRHTRSLPDNIWENSNFEDNNLEITPRGVRYALSYQRQANLCSFNYVLSERGASFFHNRDHLFQLFRKSVRKTQICGSAFCHTLRIPNYFVCSPLIPFLFLVWRKLLASTSNVFFIWFPRLLVHYEFLCPIVFVFRQIESYSPYKWHVFISIKTEQFFVYLFFVTKNELNLQLQSCFYCLLCA